MRPRVYIETTIPSYLAAWPSRDVVRAAHQRLSRQWWEARRSDFELVVSQLVLDECAAGDAEAARARLELLDGIHVLVVTEPAIRLAVEIQTSLSFPLRAANDAAHIALAAVHGCRILSHLELHAHRQCRVSRPDRHGLPSGRVPGSRDRDSRATASGGERCGLMRSWRK